MTKHNPTKIIAESGKLELIITREFEAPRELVFKAHTDPDLYVQWLGPRGSKIKFEKFEPWSGGAWRSFHTIEDANGSWSHGVYHDVTAPERIISTFEFEGFPEAGHVLLETTRFEELPGGRTRLTAQTLFQSVADRDWMYEGGIESGVPEMYERLDELFEKVVA